MRKLFEITLFFLIAIGITSCNTKPKAQASPAASIFDDSLYKYTDYKGLVEDTLAWDAFEKFIQVDSNTVKRIFPSDSSYWNFYRTAYYSKLHPIGGIQPVILHRKGDDYSAFILINFNSKQEVVDRFELSGGPCAGPDEEDSVLVLCADIHSFIFDSTHIGYYKVISRFNSWASIRPDSLKAIEVGANYDSIPIIDSMSYMLEIKRSGKIVSTLLARVRIDKHKTPAPL